MTERFIIARFSAIFIFTMEMKYKGTKSLKSAFKTEIFGIRTPMEHEYMAHL